MKFFLRKQDISTQNMKLFWKVSKRSDSQPGDKIYNNVIQVHIFWRRFPGRIPIRWETLPDCLAPSLMVEGFSLSPDTFSGIMLAVSHSDHVPGNDTWPALKCVCHSKKCEQQKYLSKVWQSILRVLVTDLPNFVNIWCRHVAQIRP